MHFKLSIVGILTVMSILSFMLSSARNEQSFITSGPRQLFIIILGLPVIISSVFEKSQDSVQLGLCIHPSPSLNPPPAGQHSAWANIPPPFLDPQTQ